MKKIIMALVAVFALVSCGGNVIGKVADVYENGAAKLEAAKTLEEVNEIDEAVKSDVQNMMMNDAEAWNEVAENVADDSDAYQGRFEELANAEAGYAVALEKAKERISSQK